MKVAALVLAAGGSVRLGRPKQLLRFQGATLVRRAASAALGAGSAPVVVVTGRDRVEIAAELADLPVEIVPNESWEGGIGTSIRAGMAALATTDAVVILTSDQPHVTSEVVRNLIEEQARTQKGIVASAYAETVGVPAFFDRKYFSILLSLDDEKGAKEILRAYAGDCSAIVFPSGGIDIDTPQDYETLGFGISEESAEK